MPTVIFLDLETTGLEPEQGVILEVAAVAVDSQLNPVDGFHRVIKPNPDTRGIQVDPYVQEMHTRNGLWAELQQPHAVYHAYAEQALFAWLAHWPADDKGKLILAGDSVHFDLGWLRHWWPDVAARFSHRLLDISAFRQARDLRGLPDCPVKNNDHRATGDVMASIAKAQWHLSRLVP